MARPTWDEYFMKLAMLASERATCPRMHCGCVLVKDKEVIATGYNGSIPARVLIARMSAASSSMTIVSEQTTLK